MDQLFSRTRTLHRLQDGPFGPHLAYLDDLATVRLQQGYAHLSVQQQIWVVAHFGDWLEAAGLGLHQVTAVILQDFLQNGLGPWSGRGMTSLTRDLVARLQRAGITAPPPEVHQTEVERIVEAFGHFLLQERGLAEATRRHYAPSIRCFLTERFEANAVELHGLAATDAMAFVRRHARDYSHGHTKVMVTALRAFFKYLLLEGKVAIDLSGAVPPVADWRLQSLPKALPHQDVEELLRHCDPQLPAGRRDRAVLLLLARLGLRAGDIVHLTLDDLDWEAGEIVLRGKGRRVHRLPLPQDAGEAVAAYLQHERPASAPTRRVFVRAYAPFDGFRSSGAICSIMRRGLRRAGLTPARKGAHLLRHALATRMLRGGASLAEIGQVLRHRRQDTTTIYAKVHLDALRPLARQWPGGTI